MNKLDGLTQPQYNALLHAIWRLDRVIKEAEEFETPTPESTMRKLRKEREVLVDLFGRIA
jgi:uncharacterized protein YdcH (DUF465 family)